MFWLMFFISLAFQVIGELLRPKPKQDQAKPSALSEFQFPTADATRLIQWWAGTCQLKGPNTVWFGNLTSKKIKKKVKTGLFSSTEIVQGFKYSLGVQLVFGWGQMDELIDFVFGDKSLFGKDAKTGTQGGYGASGAFAALAPGTPVTVGGVTVTDEGDFYSFTMDNPSLLGNDDPKEGVKGPVKIYKGTFTQPSNDYLQAQWAEVEASAFRPLCYAVLEHCYVGNSSTPPPISLVARRTPNPLGLTGGNHNIAGDANVANLCYEVMTNLIFGMKISPLKIDIDSFIECGNTLATEGLGVSMVVESATTGKALMAEMLRHVDGVIYPDPETGLYTMKLAREDYDVDDLPVFDKTCVDPDSIEFSRISWEDTKNTTVIQYVDRNSNFQVLPVQYQDPANVYVRGGQIDSEQIDFLGFSNKANATITAARVNKTRSAPLCRLQFNTNRKGWTLRPGSVLRFEMPAIGLATLVLRVTNINYGNLDNPKVQVTCVEDVFAVNAFAFDPPDDSGWDPPSATDPEALLTSRLWEVPFQMLGDERRMVGALGVRNEATAVTGFEVWVDDAGGTNYVLRDRALSTLAGGVLSTTFDRGDATLTVGNLQDDSLLENATSEEVAQGNNLLLIGDELMGWTTITDNLDGTYTFGGLVPGALDTVERDHSIGAEVFFLDPTIPSTSGEAGYSEDLTITAKLPTVTPSGTLALSGTPQITVTTDSRAVRPNPPGNFEINATRPEDLSAETGTLSITFAHRNKLVPGVIAQTTGDVGPEPGVTYILRAYDDDSDTLLIEQDGIAGSPIDFAWDTSLNLRIELSSIDIDGDESLQHQEAVLAYTTGGSTVITFPEPDPTTVEQTQQGSLLFAIAGGTGDAMTAALTPAPEALTDGMQINLRAVGANTVTNPTLDLNGFGALTIFKFGGDPLAADDIAAAGHEIILRYRASVPRWELVTPAASGGGSGASITDVQDGSLLFAIAGGTGNAMTAALSPAPAALVDGMQVHIRGVGANTIVNPTLNLNGLGAHTITRFGGQPLTALNIQSNHAMILRYNAGFTRWELANPIVDSFDKTESQSASYLFAVATGTGDAILASLTPSPPFTDGMQIRVRATAANTITNPTLNLNGLGGLVIFKQGGIALVAGDIAGAGHELELRYRAVPNRWELLNPVFTATVYTDADARAAVIASSITNGDTTHAPSGDVVYDAMQLKADITYVDAAVTGLLDFKGNIDASANPNYPVALKGDLYYVSIAGKVGGASGKSVDVGDALVAKADNAGGTEASVGTSWFVMEHNLVGALLAANNLSDLTNAGTALTNLGGTVWGKALFQLATTASIAFLRLNADGTVDAITDSAMRVALGLGTAALVADSTLVHISGTEDITGAKTFSHANGIKTTAGAMTVDRDGDATAAQRVMRTDLGFSASEVIYHSSLAAWQEGSNSSGNHFLTAIDTGGVSRSVRVISRATGVWDWKIEPTLNGALMASMSIADAGGYFTTDTVEAALQQLGAAALIGMIGVTFDGGADLIDAGTQADVYVPYACTIIGWTILSGQSGSLVVDVWKDTYSSYPPTDADSITAAAPPTLTGALKATNATLTGWTTAVAAGTTLRFNVDSVASIYRATLVLHVRKT